MAAFMAASALLTACVKGENRVDYPVVEKPTYMIYYGKVDDKVVANAKQYDIAILHPKSGDLTREQVAEIQSAGTKVLGYLSVGEDLRTAGLTAEEMLADPRFTGDGSGPRVNPRAEGDTSLIGEDGAPLEGAPSPGGSGYASYYLDDNDRDGKPDINPVFTCAYTNIGDPAWFDVLDRMTLEGEDGVAGIEEILTEGAGRGLGCDGLFLDTVDTCAPNSYTTDDNPSRTRFEWTAAGVKAFMARVKKRYPNALLCQNRGLFFYTPQLPHYRANPRAYVDYLFFESYRLDSSAGALYQEGFFRDNKWNITPKIMAEAARPDGFTVLSLGYAEGPEAYGLRETLVSGSDTGRDVLLEDIEEAEGQAGFSHYLTNGALTALNDFVKENRAVEDHQLPVWSSVYNDSAEWPPHAPAPRVGICDAVPDGAGAVRVSWDVALDRNAVLYTLYYSEKPLDPVTDPDYRQAKALLLTPEMGADYESGELWRTYPFSARVSNLTSGKTYYFAIRACDGTPQHNEEKNDTVMTVDIS